MRPATLVILAVMLVAFVSLSWMANSSLNLMRPDIDAAKELNHRFEEGARLAPGAPIKLLRVTENEAHPGLGLLVEFTPSEQVLAQAGTLGRLVGQIVNDALRAYPEEYASTLTWARVRVHLPGGAADLLGLYEVDATRRLGPPTPPWPSTWPPPPAPTPTGSPPQPPGPEAPLGPPR